jgi:hypothetical protein
MKSLWKSLWMVCALAGALTAAAGCGPQQAYCPNTGVNGGSSCPIAGNDAQTQGQDAASMQCPAGETYGVLPDGIHFGCR